jgi:sec-independent protein translocase protein TatA
MGNLGAGEIIFIAIFALLVFGPRRLPEIGRSVGKALAELRKATNELKDGFTSGFEDFKELKDFGDFREFRNLRDPLILNGPTKATRTTPQTPAPQTRELPAAEPSATISGGSPDPPGATPSSTPSNPNLPTGAGEDEANPR